MQFTRSFAYLDAIHLKQRRDSKVENTAVYIVLGVDVDGYRDVLGHWIGDGPEGADFWLSVINNLQTRGVKDILIACMDGLPGFKDAVVNNGMDRVFNAYIGSSPIYVNLIGLRPIYHRRQWFYTRK